jgi:hypothetical protein
MIQETLLQIKKKIENSKTIHETGRKDLLELLAVLESEIDQLSATDQEHAESILRFAQASAHEATRSVRKPDLQRSSLEGLQASVHGFEASHPKLVEVVNSISTALSNLGI